MLYLGISLVASKEEFYEQNGGSMMKLGMTELTITRFALENKKSVVIVVRIHEKVVQSVVLWYYMTLLYR